MNNYLYLIAFTLFVFAIVVYVLVRMKMNGKEELPEEIIDPDQLIHWTEVGPGQHEIISSIKDPESQEIIAYKMQSKDPKAVNSYKHNVRA